jgi:hypothetical protein
MSRTTPPSHDTRVAYPPIITVTVTPRADMRSQLCSPSSPVRACGRARRRPLLLFFITLLHVHLHIESTRTTLIISRHSASVTAAILQQMCVKLSAHHRPSTRASAPNANGGLSPLFCSLKSLHALFLPTQRRHASNNNCVESLCNSRQPSSFASHAVNVWTPPTARGRKRGMRDSSQITHISSIRNTQTHAHNNRFGNCNPTLLRVQLQQYHCNH